MAKLEFLRKRSIRLNRCDWVLTIIATFFIIIGIVTWIVFPIIYKKIVESTLQFKQHSDQSLSTSAWLWSHPPLNNIMNFYLFNVTNPDEIMYYGAKPALVLTGPWPYQETEEKKYMKWTTDGEEVFYENYKTFYERQDLCTGCTFSDWITIPNAPAMGVAADLYDPQYNVTEIARIIIAAGMLLVGEFPFVTQRVGEVLFTGYYDPLLAIGNSEFLNILDIMFNNGSSIVPIPIPAMPKMAFFEKYNNTQDEWYWIKTGKSNINELGEIVSWANRTELPPTWWTTDYARSIRGSDTGSFSKMNLKKTDVLPMFQSYYCRSFDAVYLNESTLHSIPSYTYSVASDEWDTTADKNIGFRYRNAENLNYFPTWPDCPNRNQTDCVNPVSVNCTLQENLCNNCCNGSNVGDTYLLPPGLYPMPCFPGRLEQPPFTLFLSPPHFAFSPKQVIDSVYGLSPDLKQDLPLVYSREPYSGSIVEAKVQVMVSQPVMPNKIVWPFMNMPASIIPVFIESANAQLSDNAYHLLWLGFVFAPRFVDVFKYCCISGGLLLLALVAFRVLRRRT